MKKTTTLKNRLIILLPLIIALFTFSNATAQNILIIYDDSPTNANTLSLKSALETEGFTVTLSSVSETAWDNTNPSLSGFNVVIHLNGTTYDVEMPTAGQLALVDFVENNGGKYIGFEWNNYEVENNRMMSMVDLILTVRGASGNGVRNYTVVPGKAAHPVLQGVGDFSITANVNGTLRTFATNPAVVLMTDENTDVVVIRKFGNGKVLGFNESGNYTSGTNSLSNANFHKLIVNFINWTGTTGTVSKLNNTSISIAPNPNNGAFSIQNDKNIVFETLSVQDISGRIVATVALQNTNGAQDVNLSKLDKGVYFVTATSKEGSITDRIVVE
jgi:hypothetical protein